MTKAKKKLSISIATYITSLILFSFVLIGTISLLVDGGALDEPEGILLFFVIIVVDIMLLVWHILEIKKISLRSSVYRRSTIKYREKCYERISRARTYYENGSITEEEFNKLKQDILNTIVETKEE